MTAEQQKGLSYEEAHAAVPVAKVVKNKAFFDGSYGGDRELPYDVTGFTPPKLGYLYHEDVVNTLKAQIAELQDQLKNHKSALDKTREELSVEKASKFSESGWFLPRIALTDGAASSLEHLIDKAKHASIVGAVVSPGAPYEIKYEADWIKYLRLFEPAPVQSWIMKLGSAAAKFHEPSVINRVDAAKQEEIIKRLMTELGQPESNSLARAFLQFANEICFGHVSLESLVQKAAGNQVRAYVDAVALENLQKHPMGEVVFGKKRKDEPADTSHYMHPYAVPAELLAGNQSASNDGINKSYVDAAPLTDEVGMVDRDVVLPEGPRTYTQEELRDPTNMQKALVMGLVGNDTQQEEARVFLRQLLDPLDNLTKYGTLR